MDDKTNDARMTSTSRPSLASQATHVEMSRAVAQVQGALVVAAQRPRDSIVSMQRIRDVCQVPALAERAFFRYARAGSTITGASIHLATELARCWGNIDFGIMELDRDDARGQSEMLAVAWDLETNTRVTNSFIVPHKRDKKGGAVALTEMRDIYENNANQAARRLRECIFRVLPTFVIEEAKTICAQTIEHGGGEPLPKRIERMLAAFGNLGIGRPQLERKIGQPVERFTAVDVANLLVIYQSLRRGEVTKDEEFPADQTGPAPATKLAALESATTGDEPVPDAGATETSSMDWNIWLNDLQSEIDQCKTHDDLDQLALRYEEPLDAAPGMIRDAAKRRIQERRKVTR